MAWLVYGQRSDGELLHISEAQRGEACGCACPHCGTPLATKKGTVKVHHFAHFGSTCAYVSVYDFFHIEQFVDTTLSLSQWAVWKQQDMEQTKIRLQTELAHYSREMTQLLADVNLGRDTLSLISQPAKGRTERSKQRQINFEALQKWDAILADHNIDEHQLVPSLGNVRDLESWA